MKNAWFFILIVMFASCGNKKNIPDVSSIKVDLDVLRFDKDFFFIDTSNMENELNDLQKRYPSFLNDFLYNILGAPPQKDSVLLVAKSFYKDYKSVYNAVEEKFKSINKPKQDITKGLQFVKYYFPQYNVPENIITFIGPLEGYANVLTDVALAIGLQLYLGEDFPLYHSAYILEVYPAYRQRRFKPEYIAVNSMKNIIEDIYPEQNNISGQPLVYQMIEAGKRLYMLDKFLPETVDTLKTGYTEAQLNGAYENESAIWNFFVQNNLLFITDPLQTRDYMQDAPRTETLGPASPGFIGQFVGWQIVKKYVSQKEDISLQQLLQTSAKDIYNEAKYKPR